MRTSHSPTTPVHARVPTPAPAGLAGAVAGARTLARAAAACAAATCAGVAGAALVSAALAADGADALEHPAWGPALASQAAAIESASGPWLDATAAVERAELGLRGRLEALPSAAWSGGPGRATAASSGVTLTARLDWSHDPAALALALLSEHRSRIALVEAVHREVRETTSAYLDLRRAHVALAQAEAAVTTRRATFERAEASVLGRDLPSARAGAASDVELGVARLELERVLAGVDRAARDLAAAARRARLRGIDVDAAARAHRAVQDPDPLEGWRLPAVPAAAEGVAVERRALELALARARLARQGAWSALDDVRLEASLIGRDARARIGLGLDEGRPGAFVEAGLRGAARESWNLGVRARIRIDDSWHDDLSAARRAVAEAEAALAAARAEERALQEELRRAVVEAEEDVAFAERSLELGRAALRGLDAERVAVAAAARIGEEGAEARLARFDEASARATLGHLRERDALVRAWERYLRAAERAGLAVAATFGAPVRSADD